MLVGKNKKTKYLAEMPTKGRALPAAGLLVVFVLYLYYSWLHETHRHLYSA
jgi:hypothetical protein